MLVFHKKLIIILLLVFLALYTVFIKFIDLMGVVRLLEPLNDTFVLWSTLLSTNDTRRVLKVQEVFCREDRVESVSDHDYCQISSLLLLHVQDCILHLSFALWV